MRMNRQCTTHERRAAKEGGQDACACMCVMGDSLPVASKKKSLLIYRRLLIFFQLPACILDFNILVPSFLCFFWFIVSVRDDRGRDKKKMPEQRKKLITTKKR